MAQAALSPQSVEAVEGFIIASPFGRLVHLRAGVTEHDHVRVELPYRSELTTIANMVHGGAIASLIDVAATAACWASPDASLEARGSTVALTINYLAPALGCDLSADARVTKRGGSLCVCDVAVADATTGTTVARALVTYRLALPRDAPRPVAEPIAELATNPASRGPDADDPRFELVRAYAAAKSNQDVDAALALCHADFSIDTIAFGTASRDRAETAVHLAAFFSVFPDYRAETESIAANADGVLWLGHVSMTFAGELPGIAPTRRKARIPAFCRFEFRDGLLLRERFFFDLKALCDGIGIDVGTLADALAGLRSAAA